MNNIQKWTQHDKKHQTDKQKLSSWIQNRHEFTVSVGRMGHWKHFSSGSIADESTSVDCDRAESNGQEIGENLEGIELGQAKVKPKG